MNNVPVVIKGAGGGGGGGGSTRVAKEAPDTLQSVQYARILDLVSEGEIQGLVNGEHSIFINDTPLRNENGSYNFSGVTLDYRLGTQSQSYIQGFPAVENEVAVGSEVKANLPVTRTITNPNINAVRVTVSVSSLTEQNTSNGDINGTSVTLQVHYQNNGGGYIPARLQVKTLNLSISGFTATSGSNQILNASLGISWVGSVKDRNIQRCSWVAEYRALPSGSWTQFASGNFSGVRSETRRLVEVGDGGNYVTDIFAPTANATADLTNVPESAYEFRVIKTSGTGTLSLSYATGQYFTPDITISGKTRSRYQRSIRLDLPPGGPWDIRVSRVTPDSTSAALQNATFFESYTEIIDAKLSYPNSAIFGLQIDARQFNSIPSRSYEIYGIKVKVPDNYDPITRTYTGEWTGNFKIAWTNNPAWIFYDLVTNNRYGLGEFIDVDSVDKWGLYTIAKYCDEFVSDGLGGVEPRFTCNTFIQTRYEAYDLLNQLASIFRAMIFWSAGQITCVQDSPADPIALFNSSNVIDGQFNYSGSSVKTRHTVALVTWNDPKDRYRQKIEYVEDPEGIARYGVIETEVMAFGCTSRGQAHRVGKWILYSERMETETVSFKAGMDAALIYPGAVIQTQDQFRSGKRFGGRTFGSTASIINLDSSVNIELGKTYELSIVLPDGSVETRPVSNLPGETTTITPTTSFSQDPVDGAIWILSASDLVPETWRVVSISEEGEGIVSISALSYRKDKYDAIESDLILEPIPSSVIRTGSNFSVSNLNISEELYLITPVVVGNRVTLSWTGDSPVYIVSYSSSNINPVFVESANSSYVFTGIQPGIYTFSVQPVNALGIRGQITSVTKEIYGLTAHPKDVSGLALAALSGNAYITFNASTDLDVIVGGKLRLKHSANSLSWNDAVDIGVYIPGTATSAVVPLLQGNYLAKWVDSSGIESVNAVSIQTNAPSIINLNLIESATEHHDFIGNKINVGLDEFNNLPAITLDSVLTIDEMTTEIDSWPQLSALGGVSNLGTYKFNNSVDLGKVYTSRLTADLQTWGYNPSDVVDTWGLIDTLESIDGDVIPDVSARIFVRTSDDNITFTGWEPLIVGDYSARAFEFKLELTSAGTNNIAVTQCAVHVDMPDMIQAADDITSGAGTYNVVYPKAFFSSPAIGITAQDMQTGDYYEITNKSGTGFDIVFKDQSGTNISRTFDYIAKGY